MKQYGLIGYPLTHSFSPGYFHNKFSSNGINAEYLSFPLKEIGELPELIMQNENLCGLNVTIPYKKQVIKFLDEVSPEALTCGAVNTILIDRTKSGKYGRFKLFGYNTDIFGFNCTMNELRKKFTQALVFGTGGASSSVQFVLQEKNIPFKLVSRTKTIHSITYEELTSNMVSECDLLINTTPLGMFPDFDECVDIDYTSIEPKHALIDLIYNPEETLFLKNGRLQGAATINGLHMLHMQAEKSWEIWNSSHPETGQSIHS